MGIASGALGMYGALRNFVLANLQSNEVRRIQQETLIIEQETLIIEQETLIIEQETLIIEQEIQQEDLRTQQEIQQEDRRFQQEFLIFQQETRRIVCETLEKRKRRHEKKQLLLLVVLNVFSRRIQCFFRVIVSKSIVNKLRMEPRNLFDPEFSDRRKFLLKIDDSRFI